MFRWRNADRELGGCGIVRNLRQSGDRQGSAFDGLSRRDANFDNDRAARVRMSRITLSLSLSITRSVPQPHDIPPIASQIRLLIDLFLSTTAKYHNHIVSLTTIMPPPDYEPLQNSAALV